MNVDWRRVDEFNREFPVAAEDTLDVSVVCPFYNESSIIHAAVTGLLAKLKELDISWELIVVNDGCTDGSEQIVSEIARDEPRLRLLSYRYNRGRGYALRTGIARARGAVIVTTEIDLSWGDDIVSRLYQAMVNEPQADIIVASPNLPGGGYKNVPFSRVLASRIGNVIVRTLMSNAVTMNTGMTRAYRRPVIQSLPLEEDRKEFHLEVIMKAQALKYRISEIPCVLEWKEYKHEGKRVKRKSSSKIKKLMLTHSMFSLFANPMRYVWGLGVGAVLLSVAFLVWSVFRLVAGQVSVFTLIVSLSFAIIAVLLFTFGVIAQQGLMVQREIWTLKRDITHLRHKLEVNQVLEFHGGDGRPEERANGESVSHVRKQN